MQINLHAHPELGFEEDRTSDFVAGKLAEFGCGFVAILVEALTSHRVVRHGLAQIVPWTLRLGSASCSIETERLSVKNRNHFRGRGLCAPRVPPTISLGFR
jgi:hypothetical protein